MKIDPAKITKNWHSLLHLTIGGDYRNKGDRVPGIFLQKTTTGEILLRIYDMGPGGADIVKSESYFRNWITLEISQYLEVDSYVYKVVMDGKVYKEVKQTTPLEFDNVSIYASDKYYPSTYGSMRFLLIEGMFFQFPPKISNE